jgi:hypothetical protein
VNNSTEDDPGVSQQRNDENRSDNANDDANDDDNDEQFLPILRQLLSYLTLLGKVGSFQVGSVQAFRTVVKSAGEATSGLGLNSHWLTCALQWNFYEQFIVVAVLPPIIVVVCAIGVRLGFARTSWRAFARAVVRPLASLEDSSGYSSTRRVDQAVDDSKDRKIRCFFDAAIVYCLFMAFPTVSKQLFDALNCVTITLVSNNNENNGTSVHRYLASDFRVSCTDNPSYDLVQGFAIALVGLYVILPPLALGWWLTRNRDFLDDEMRMRRLGFLYQGYRLQAYPWWASVSFLSKTAISAIMVFLTNALEQMITALLVFAVLLTLQMGARPFETAMLNNLQVLAYIALLVTQFVPIFISVYKTANQQAREQDLDSGTATAVSVGLLAVNGGVVICYLVCAWRERGTLMDTAETNMWKARGMAGKFATKVRRSSAKEDTTSVEMTINANADASFMAGVLSAASANDEALTASGDGLSPYSFSATSRVAPGGSSEGGGLGVGGEEKPWGVNPFRVGPDRTRSDVI